MVLGYIYTDELDKAIREYCYENSLTIKRFSKQCKINYNTYYVAKKRGTIGMSTVYRLRKVLKDFDFNSLPRRGDGMN